MPPILSEYIKLLKSLVDRLQTTQANLSLVSGKILDSVVAIATPLLQFARFHKSETTTTLDDGCISRLGDLLDPLRLELACLQRHYIRHLEHEEAASGCLYSTLSADSTTEVPVRRVAWL